MNVFARQASPALGTSPTQEHHGVGTHPPANSHFPGSNQHEMMYMDAVGLGQGASVDNDTYLFLAKISAAATENDVEALFSMFGRVTDIQLFRHNEKSWGCGVLSMSTAQEAWLAQRALNGLYVWPGMSAAMLVQPMNSQHLQEVPSRPASVTQLPLHSQMPLQQQGALAGGISPTVEEVQAAVLEYLSERRQRPPKGCSPDAIKLFVGNVPKHYQEAWLRPIFDPFGTVVELVVMRDRYTRDSKGSGFVWYSTRAEAERAILALHGQCVLPEQNGPGRHALAVRPATVRKRQPALEQQMPVRWPPVGRHLTPPLPPLSHGAGLAPMRIGYGYVEPPPPPPDYGTTSTANSALMQLADATQGFVPPHLMAMHNAALRAHLASAINKRTPATSPYLQRQTQSHSQLPQSVMSLQSEETALSDQSHMAVYNQQIQSQLHQIGSSLMDSIDDESEVADRNRLAAFYQQQRRALTQSGDELDPSDLSHAHLSQLPRDAGQDESDLSEHSRSLAALSNGPLMMPRGSQSVSQLPDFSRGMDGGLLHLHGHGVTQDPQDPAFDPIYDGPRNGAGPPLPPSSRARDPPSSAAKPTAQPRYAFSNRPEAAPGARAPPSPAPAKLPDLSHLYASPKQPPRSRADATIDATKLKQDRAAAASNGSSPKALGFHSEPFGQDGSRAELSAQLSRHEVYASLLRNPSPVDSQETLLKSFTDLSLSARSGTQRTPSLSGINFGCHTLDSHDSMLGSMSTAAQDLLLQSTSTATTVDSQMTLKSHSRSARFPPYEPFPQSRTVSATTSSLAQNSAALEVVDEARRGGGAATADAAAAGGAAAPLSAAVAERLEAGTDSGSQLSLLVPSSAEDTIFAPEDAPKDVAARAIDTWTRTAEASDAAAQEESWERYMLALELKG